MFETIAPYANSQTSDMPSQQFKTNTLPGRRFACEHRLLTMSRHSNVATVAKTVGEVRVIIFFLVIQELQADHLVFYDARMTRTRPTVIPAQAGTQ